MSATQFPAVVPSPGKGVKPEIMSFRIRFFWYHIFYAIDYMPYILYTTYYTINTTSCIPYTLCMVLEAGCGDGRVLVELYELVKARAQHSST